MGVKARRLVAIIVQKYDNAPLPPPAPLVSSLGADWLSSLVYFFERETTLES